MPTIKYKRRLFATTMNQKEECIITTVLFFLMFLLALVKGKWNLSEYEQELTPLFNEYGVDQTERENF